MKKCIIDGIVVDEKIIRSNSIAFGKSIDAEFAIPFRLELTASDAIANFSAYYQEFLDRESEDEGFEEALDGNFLLLKETGYLPFEKMIIARPELLARVIKDELPAEFLGYIFLDNDASVGSKKYILQNLTSVSIGDGKIICTGYAFANPRYSV